MHSSHGIDLAATDDLYLACPSCANTLSSRDRGASVCSICREPIDVEGRGLADASAILELRRRLASRIEEVEAAAQRAAELARPPMWNWLLIGINLMSRYIAWEASLDDVDTSRARSMGWDVPLRAPLYADPAALREQRQLHALIAWSVELTAHMYGKRSAETLRRGTMIFALIVTATLVLSAVPDYAPQLDPRILQAIGISITAVTILFSLRPMLRTVREARWPEALSARLRREILSAGLRYDRKNSIWFGPSQRLQTLWAGDFDHDDLNQGRGATVIRGGADAQDQPSEAFVFVRCGERCKDIVLYLPMVDVRGAIEPPAQIARTCAARHLADLRRRGWSIVEESAGLCATWFVDDPEALTSADWRTLAEDVSVLLEVPAGLGRLSSSTARAHLAAHGVVDFSL